jgi:putative hemolysin
MAVVTEHTIDIEKILASKVGDKMKFIPKSLVNWLIRTTHQEELNEFIWRSRDHEGYDWLEDCVKFLDMNLKVEGFENLPDKDSQKRYTFVSNHPLGGGDGVALGAILGRKYGNDIRLIVNDILMHLPGLAPLCIPVNTTTSKRERAMTEMVEKGFASDYNLLLFPAGLCSRKIDGKIQDLEWKKTFITKSIESQRDIVPIHFEGHNSNKFYRIANICKMLKLKVNVAMLYLPDEMIKNRHNTFTVRIGKPIPWQTFDKSRKPKEWAQWVREQVYELGK